MRRFVLISLMATIAITGCKKSEPATSASSSNTTTQSSTTSVTSTSITTSASAPGAAPAPSLISFSSGALVVVKPPDYGSGWESFRLIDDRSDAGYATPQNVVGPQTAVIALPEKTQLDRLEFDNAHTDGENRGAKDVTVEMSDTSADSGFQKIADVSLQDKVDGQSFPVTAQVPGRWLKITLRNNHGAPDYVELMEVRGFGKQLTQTPFANVSGTYETNFGNFHLKQEGSSLTGCYEHGGGLLNGGIEGRVMRLTWRQDGPTDGPALMVFTPDGKQMFGLWWYTNDTNGPGSEWNGKKISDEVGSCPNWSSSGGAEQQITKDLEEFGRTRIYGINFDTDSATIRDESKPTLDKIVAVMKAKPEWKLTVEGHTDSSGNEPHNQELSQHRAESVKTYLSAGGIDAARLSASGLGSSKPVGDNASATGRSSNRRVELTKQ